MRCIIVWPISLGAVPFNFYPVTTNATLPYAVMLANMGWEKACAKYPDLRFGLNIVDGKVVYKAVADTFGLPFEELILQ